MLTWTQNKVVASGQQDRISEVGAVCQNYRLHVIIYLELISSMMFKDRKRVTSLHKQGTNKGWDGQETRNELF